MTDTNSFEAACRAACVQDGRDPDEIVRLSGVNANLVNPMPPMLPQEYGRPCWQAYLHEVQRIVVIADALDRWQRKPAGGEEPVGPITDASQAKRDERDRVVAIIRERQDHYTRCLGELDMPGPFNAQHAIVAQELLRILDLIDPPPTIEMPGRAV